MKEDRSPGLADVSHGDAPPVKMHADEVHTDASLVQRLVAAQFADWAALPVRALASSGTVNALYRLGDDKVVRMPRRAAHEVESEHATLRRLAPLVPVKIPEPLATGQPGEGYPWLWCVDRWLPGEHPTAGEITGALATDLADLVRALLRMDTTGAPPSARGSTLRRWDAPTRAAIAQLGGTIDAAAASAAWEDALATPEWSGAAVWVHGDLMPANLLVRDGRLTGVLDWGGAGVADPAVDLAVAWNTLSASTRATFRAKLDVDDATWARGRGWALWTGLVALPYYRETNPTLAHNARYRLDQILNGLEDAR
jgi:aminoglycoside phosphotransferase (APT) family kinase protein